MLEIEMKFPVEALPSVREKLLSLTADPPVKRREEDQYFNASDRDFADTDEALRLRRIGSANFATYKGPRAAGDTKTRTEIEVCLREGDETAIQFEKFLRCLGFRPVAKLQKDREIFHLERGGFRIEACLDCVAGVGNFVELEILAPEEQYQAARRVLLSLADEIGLKNPVTLSYLEMLLDARGGTTE
ncbi:MAG: adenylyl cyclase [Gemmatales bacterium]|nr:MAG: adenylyl cyclase [Gemmatales bacterium]